MNFDATRSAEEWVPTSSEEWILKVTPQVLAWLETATLDDAERVIKGAVNGAVRAAKKKPSVEELGQVIPRERRRQLEKRLRRPFRGGWFVNWGGELSAALSRMIERLREAYGVTKDVPAEVTEFTSLVDVWVDEEGVEHELRRYR